MSARRRRRAARLSRARERRGRPPARASRSTSPPTRPRPAASARAADRAAQPDARLEIEGEKSAGAVLLVDERWRRRPVGRSPAPNRPGAAAARRELLSRARARAVHRDAPRRCGDAAEARARRADHRRYRAAARSEDGRRAQMDRKGGVLLRFAGPHLAAAGRPAAAGAAAQRRPHDRRRAVLGAAGTARAVPRRQPVRRARRSRRRAVSRQVLAEPDLDLGEQDLGAAGRRHAAGDRARSGARAGSCWSTRRPTPTGRTSPCPASSSRCCGAWSAMSQGVRRRRGGRASAAAGDARRVRPAAAPPPTAADHARRSSPPTAVAAPSAGLLRHADARAARSTCGPAVPPLKPIGALPRGRAARALRARREIDLRPGC